MAKTGIGYGSLTDTVYLGKQNKERGLWIGEKKDITSDFLFVLSQYIPEFTTRTIRNGNHDILYISIPKTKEGFERAMKFITENLPVEGKMYTEEEVRVKIKQIKDAVDKQIVAIFDKQVTEYLEEATGAVFGSLENPDESAYTMSKMGKVTESTRLLRG